ncbi:MAG: metallophosphoesterase family protein [Terriglobales bacterium]|jgi:putative phosphoesterase
MKVALLSDIHANLPAFSAVLNDLPNVDILLCLGDMVGYYLDSNEVCELVRRHNICAIRGNHDAYVLGELTPNPDRAASYRTEWTRQTLAVQHLAWLRTLPTVMEFRWGRMSVRLCHAAPWSEEAYVYPDSPKLSEISLAQNEILVLGHTHRPMRVRCGNGFVINPGSVGQPRDYNPQASYAILDTASGNVDFRRVHYELAPLQDRLLASGCDPVMIAMLSRTEPSRHAPHN